jgi:hypothetical protein
MLHERRTFQVADVATPEELAAKLAEHTWTTCTGFRLGSLLLLNDSTSEDGAQEYAVLRGSRQVESLTVSWCSREELAARLQVLAAGGPGVDMGEVVLRLNHPAGTCEACA